MAQNVLNFIQFFGKFWQNRMLAPQKMLAPTPTGNPGSAPGSYPFGHFLNSSTRSTVSLLKVHRDQIIAEVFQEGGEGFESTLSTPNHHLICAQQLIFCTNKSATDSIFHHTSTFKVTHCDYQN